MGGESAAEPAVFTLDSILKPIKPKKALTSFYAYKKVLYRKTADRLLGNGQDIPNLCMEVGKVMGQEWSAMTDKQKQPYIDLSIEDGKRYEKDLKQLEELGYFTNADGSKSCDMKLHPRNFKAHVTLPKRRLGIFNAYIKHLFETKKKSMGADAKTTEVLKALCEDWKKLPDKKKAVYQKKAEAD